MELGIQGSMFYYKLDYDLGSDGEYSTIVAHEDYWSKEDFNSVCEKYFRLFPKEEFYDKLTRKTYYTFNECDCIEFITDSLVELEDFKYVNIESVYSKGG